MMLPYYVLKLFLLISISYISAFNKVTLYQLKYSPNIHSSYNTNVISVLKAGYTAVYIQPE